MAVSTRPLTPRFGVEIKGIDIRKPINDRDFAEIERLWYENGIVLFRKQQFDEGDIVNFSRRFGDLEVHVRKEFLDPMFPELLQVSNITQNGRDVGILKDKELGWHHDQSYMLEPAIGSMLCAFDLPKKGGDTSFANLAVAYEELSPDMKLKLEGLWATHSYAYFNGTWSVPTNEAQTNRTPPVLQPVVRTHPITSRKALYINQGMVPMIDGISEIESRNLLDYLFEWMVRPSFVYRHKWELGDAIMWDNAATIHRREAFDPASRRLMKRTTIRPKDGLGVPF
tara:strand:+ start:4140 stop:4988 length:849 start_codon:yes stop_codon:yes gene_type:complete